MINYGNRGITLVALVITIIILLILAGITIGLFLGEGGIIDRAKEASFKSNLSEIEEKVILYWTEKEYDGVMSGTNPSLYEKLPIKVIGDNETTVDDSDFKPTLILEIENLALRDVEDVRLYEIDKDEIGVHVSHTYLIDIDNLQVYDKEGERFKGKFYHTLKSLGVDDPNLDTGAETARTEEEKYLTDDGDGWLKPDLSGYSMNYTKLVYYNENDFDDTLEIPIQEYVDNGRQSNFERDGKRYVLDGYDQQMWANIKNIANGLESWWVWNPRYAYKINGKNSLDIVFIDTNDVPIGTKYEGKYTVNGDNTITIEDEIYYVQPGFNLNNGKKLQGIWMSKYEPSSTSNVNYSLDSGNCYAPNLDGFDLETTYIELYDAATDEFIEEKKLSEVDLKTINEDNKWYDYKNKIWANIKTTANGLESWWVWQPRYAYSITNAAQEVDVLFVDTKNKPYDKESYGSRLPSGMIVHPGFTVYENGSKKQLQGIWMSKYEPSTVYHQNKIANSGECIEPKLDNFDEDTTYIIYWNSDFSKTREVSLRDYINGGKQRKISYQDEGDTEPQTYVFYDYKNKIWANIKTMLNNNECWWVWQPRYAYSIEKAGQDVDVLFITTDDKPVDTATYGNTLKPSMIVHPGFNLNDGTKLEGIWMSKYEPSYK